MDNQSSLSSVTLVEHQHINEMQDSLRKRMSESRRQGVDRMDTVSGAVLGHVVAEEDERAREDLETYVEMKTTFPGFQERAARYVEHCGDLIQAISTKRNFPGLAALSLSKQHELHEKVLEHFEELKQNLKHLEKLEREQKLADVRSTVWVLRALCQAVALVFMVALISDFEAGFLSSAVTVVDATVDAASTWVVNLIPLK